MMQTDLIAAALEAVLDRDIPDEGLSDAVSAQARLMAREWAD